MNCDASSSWTQGDSPAYRLRAPGPAPQPAAPAVGRLPFPFVDNNRYGSRLPAVSLGSLTSALLQAFLERAALRGRQAGQEAVDPDPFDDFFVPQPLQDAVGAHLVDHPVQAHLLDQAIDADLVDEAIDADPLDEAIDADLLDQASNAELIDEAIDGDPLDQAIDADLVQDVVQAQDSNGWP